MIINLRGVSTLNENHHGNIQGFISVRLVCWEIYSSLHNRSFHILVSTGGGGGGFGITQQKIF